MKRASKIEWFPFDLSWDAVQKLAKAVESIDKGRVLLARIAAIGRSCYLEAAPLCVKMGPRWV